MPIETPMLRPVPMPAVAGNVELAFADGTAYTLHPLWLRERCTSPLSVQPSTGQRIFELSDLVAGEGHAGVVATNARVDVSTSRVTVTFSDGHASEFDAASLRRQVLDMTAWPDVAGGGWDLPTPILWGADDMAASPPLHHHDAVVSDGDAMVALLTQLHQHGIAIVTGVPTKDRAAAAFGRHIGPVRDTNWGAVFDVRNNVDADGNPTVVDCDDDADADADAAGADDVDLADLAYTTLPLGLHVDNPYRDPAPGYQLLHCLIAAESGGENIVADGWRAAERMRELRPDLFRALVLTRSRFSYVQDTTNLVTFRPTFVLDTPLGEAVDLERDAVREIFYSPRLDYAPALPADELGAFYEARAMYNKLLHATDSVFEYKLRSGDLLIVNNQRVLHGRRGFSAQGGRQARHVQGCYIDRDGTTSTYWTLQRAKARAAASASATATAVAAGAGVDDATSAVISASVV